MNIIMMDRSHFPHTSDLLDSVLSMPDPNPKLLDILLLAVTAEADAAVTTLDDKPLNLPVSPVKPINPTELPLLLPAAVWPRL